MTSQPENSRDRYDRQTKFAPLGLDGQEALAGASALVVGVGGLGSWVSVLLARAGVGLLRLVDDDRVELTNIHRQAMYDEKAAAEHILKVDAAAKRLGEINSEVRIKKHPVRLSAQNIAELADGMDMIVDGCDNFRTRFIINDYCVKTCMPWVFAGVVGAEAQVMPVLPGETMCLRCIYDSPLPPELEPSNMQAGVLGAAVAAIAGIESVEAMKILAGRKADVRRELWKLDMWSNKIQTMVTTKNCAHGCPCCDDGHFEYLA